MIWSRRAGSGRLSFGYLDSVLLDGWLSAGARPLVPSYKVWVSLLPTGPREAEAHWCQFCLHLIVCM